MEILPGAGHLGEAAGYGSWPSLLDWCPGPLRPGLRPVPALAAGRNWVKILTRLQVEADAKGLITWDVNVDSTAAGPISTRPGR
ncbi:hypothetical protein [Streptomyces sp. ISL-44]|uniref:hypothetical protein n=1 Tax=Streptomyces sp. ISL-44 TaxID=2819184 RepID=UPI002035275C|nr:hypothetical protein [Streptomyces sp. ISL-44]